MSDVVLSYDELCAWLLTRVRQQRGAADFDVPSSWHHVDRKYLIGQSLALQLAARDAVLTPEDNQKLAELARQQRFGSSASKTVLSMLEKYGKITTKTQAA